MTLSEKLRRIARARPSQRTWDWTFEVEQAADYIETLEAELAARTDSRVAELRAIGDDMKALGEKLLAAPASPERGTGGEHWMAGGPPLYRCACCGDPKSDHRRDDDEHRECTLCECEEYVSSVANATGAREEKP